MLGCRHNHFNLQCKTKTEVTKCVHNTRRMQNIEGAKPDQAHSAIVILLCATFVPITRDKHRQTNKYISALSSVGGFTPIASSNGRLCAFDMRPLTMVSCQMHNLPLLDELTQIIHSKPVADTIRVRERREKRTALRNIVPAQLS